MAPRSSLPANLSHHRQFTSWRWLVFLISLTAAYFVPPQAYSHPSPNSQLFLDISTGRVVVDAYIPMPELALVMGEEVQKSPQTFAQQYDTQIRAYMMNHIQAYTDKNRPWKIVIENIRMDKGIYMGTNIPYWELFVQFILTPEDHDDTRSFTIEYDAVLHQVVNHVALVSIRRDWEAGIVEDTDTTRQASVIGWDLGNNTIPPLIVTLDAGSAWNGFNSMFMLGMQHIREGTDHLLFLLTLLLAAPLTVRSRRWSEYGGLRYSLYNLIKIVTAFTVGHSITLLVGALGWMKLPTQPVEIMIAVSILISAVHAFRPIFPDKEVYVAAGFGLVHGLAFASTLSDLNFGFTTMIASVLAFNIGIEAMQLMVVALVAPWLILLSRFASYQIIRIAGSTISAIAALGWLTERLAGNSNLITNLIQEMTRYFPAALIALALYAIALSCWHRRMLAKRSTLKNQISRSSP